MKYLVTEYEEPLSVAFQNVQSGLIGIVDSWKLIALRSKNELAVDLRGEEGELQKRMMSSTEELLKEDIKRNDLKDGVPLKKPPQPLPDKNEPNNRKKDKKTMGCCGTSDCTLM